jgi:hypothetical protein
MLAHREIRGAAQQDGQQETDAIQCRSPSPWANAGAAS